MNLKSETLFYVEGDAKDLGIYGIDCKVSTVGITLTDSPKNHKMVLVKLDKFNNTKNVILAIKKEFIRLI